MSVACRHRTEEANEKTGIEHFRRHRDAAKEVPVKIVKTADWEMRDAVMQTESTQYNVH